MQLEILDKPIRYYYNDRAGSGRYYNEQIKEIGPYTKEQFMDKPKRLIVITPKEYEGTVETFSKKLKDSLKSTFHIDCSIEVLEVKGKSLEDYTESIYSYGFSNIDCAIIIVSEDQVSLPIKKSPYYYTKAKYIGQGIPTQEVKIQNLQSVYGFDFKLNNIALNIYAKLGGTPWAIEKIEPLKKEFIVGIGSTINKEKKSVMGIANIFDYTGKYFVGNCVPLSDYANYSIKLEKALYKMIDNIITNDDKDIRIIFHIFKSPSNKYEIKAINKVIKYFDKVNISYAFVRVGYNHNYRLFNNEGKSNIQKGTMISISENESLICFTDKSSIPLKISVDERSTFYDLYYLAKQIYWFFTSLK